jgi:hypothetical protein
MKQVLLILVLVIWVPYADAEGRLFYTPAQRAGLENARRHHITEAIAPPTSDGPPPLTFNGVVLRSDGQDTLWINGQPQAGKHAAPKYQGHTLKPGQTAVDGKIYDPQQIIREISQ